MFPTWKALVEPYMWMENRRLESCRIEDAMELYGAVHVGYMFKQQYRLPLYREHVGFTPG